MGSTGCAGTPECGTGYTGTPEGGTCCAGAAAHSSASAFPGAAGSENRGAAAAAAGERCPRRGETVAPGRAAGANTAARNLAAFVGRVGYSKFPM